MLLNRRTSDLSEQAATRRKWLASAALMLAAVAVASCTKLIGPTAAVAPGAGKSQPAFDADRRACMSTTDRAIQPMANSLNLNGLSRNAAEISADNARIQEAYDASFARCMADNGDIVASNASSAKLQARTPNEEMLNSSNSPFLTDADSRAAAHLMEKDAAQLRHACPGEEIQVAAHAAPLAPDLTARLVVVSQPRGGVCMGSRGEADYLYAKGAHGWSLLLTGLISIRGSVHAGFRDVQIEGRGGDCTYDFEWDGKRYVKIRVNDCPFDDGGAVGGDLN